MPLITTDDIKEMKQRGYDSVTISRAKQDLIRAGLANELINLIHIAFQDVQLGDGIGLREALGLDDYEDESTCAAYREKDEKTNWISIPLKALQSCNSSPSFFDANGFRFHLPAYMCADLSEDYGYGFINSLTCFKILKYDRYLTLKPSERMAVRVYLLYQLDHPDNTFGRDDIEKALNNYWTEESCAE